MGIVGVVGVLGVVGVVGFVGFVGFMGVVVMGEGVFGHVGLAGWSVHCCGLTESQFSLVFHHGSW